MPTKDAGSKKGSNLEYCYRSLCFSTPHTKEKEGMRRKFMLEGRFNAGGWTWAMDMPTVGFS